MTLRVAAQDIDGQGHVNNVVYLRWAQDVAVAHWKALAPAEDQTATGWVVLRHEIDYKGAGRLDDRITVRTWVGSVAGLSFERHTEIVRAADQKLLARVQTMWCPINPETGRLQRVRPGLRDLFSVPRCHEEA